MVAGDILHLRGWCDIAATVVMSPRICVTVLMILQCRDFFFFSDGEKRLRRETHRELLVSAEFSPQLRKSVYDCNKAINARCLYNLADTLSNKMSGF